MTTGDHAECASDRNISGLRARRARVISSDAHEIGTIGYVLVTKRTATNAPTKPARVGRGKRTGVKKYIRERAKRPPINPAARAANDAIADATNALLGARIPPKRRAALEKLRQLVAADIARVNGEDRAAAVLAADGEVDAMRMLKGAQLGAALRAAAEAIADESDDKRFATFEPTKEDVQTVERKLRARVKGRWLVAYLAHRTGAFDAGRSKTPSEAERPAELLQASLKKVPAVRRLRRR